VYREQAKADKSKKGSSNVNSAVVKGKGTSVASTPKSVPAKGKDKATIVLPPPSAFTTLRLAGESISSGPSAAMDVDDDIDIDADSSMRADTDGEVDERMEEEEEEEPEVNKPKDLEEEPEELVDTVALELDELLHDSKGPGEGDGDPMEH
jgi:DNA polymerase epsilon subunit 3